MESFSSPSLLGVSFSGLFSAFRFTAKYCRRNAAWAICRVLKGRDNPNAIFSKFKYDIDCVSPKNLPRPLPIWRSRKTGFVGRLNNLINLFASDLSLLHSLASMVEKFNLIVPKQLPLVYDPLSDGWTESPHSQDSDTAARHLQLIFVGCAISVKSRKSRHFQITPPHNCGAGLSLVSIWCPA